jgi:hypothetical protein
MVLRVFISYSHDSAEHLDRVWNLSERLRQDGVDCRIDQYEESPAEGWPRWCSNHVDEAEFVLIVCTEIYQRRYEGKDKPGTGRGVKWEGHIITQELYEADARNTKFIPVVFSASDSTHIPKELRSATNYNIHTEQDYEKLFRRLTNQPERRPSKVADRLRSMPTRGNKGSSPPEVASLLSSMPNLERKQHFSAPVLSGRDLALIAFMFVVIGVGLLALFVLVAPKLLPANALDKFFYVIAIVWAIVCALVLFGILNSYAHVTHKSVGLVVVVGGPAAFAALIIVGAFWVPRIDAFDLTVRPHGPDQQLITSGKIRIELGSLALTQDVNLNGEADFKGIAYRYRGTSVRMLPQIEGYIQNYQEVRLDKDAIDLNLVKSFPPMTVLRGRLTPAPPKSQLVSILVEGEDGESVPDHFGRFQIVVHKRIGERVGLNACAGGRSIYNNYITLSEDEIEIPVHKQDDICGRQ